MRCQVLGGEADGAAECDDLGLVHAHTLVPDQSDRERHLCAFD